MNLFCPKIDSSDFEEMLQAFTGEQEAYIYYLWNANNGNPLYLDHKGNPSLLFEDLLSYTDGDRLEAMRLKSTMFNYKFRDYFGDWLSRDFKPEEYNVYDNGEPQMDNILDIQIMEKAKPGHMDPRVQSAIDKYGEELITDLNNPNVWDIEKELGLLDKETPFVVVTGEKFRRKQLQGFSENKARELMQKVRDMGGYAFPVDVRTKEGRLKTGVGVGYKIGRPIKKRSPSVQMKHGEIFDIAGKSYVANERDLPSLKEILRQIEINDYDGMSLLFKLFREHSKVFENNPELMEAANILLKNRKKDRKIGVDIVNFDIEATMEYDPSTHRINVSTHEILSASSLEAFIDTFVHEMYHAVLSDSLDNPSTVEDIQFKKTIEEIYNDLKKHNILSNKYSYAFTDIHEFLSVFMGNSEFATDLKKYKAPVYEKSFYERVIDVIVQFIYMSTGYNIRKEKGVNLHDYIKKTVSDFMDKRANYYDSNNYKANVIYQKKKSEILNRYKDIQQIVDPNKPETIVTALHNLKTMYTVVATKDEHSYTEKGTGITYDSVTEYMAEHGYGLSKRRKSKMTQTELDRLTRAGNIGTATHMSLEGQVKDITEDILKETGFTMQQDAIDMLTNILTDIKKSKTPRNGSITVLSEVLITDPTLKLAGTIDLMIIDNQGRIHIFDFKTKERGFQWYASSSYPPTDKEKYHLQLGIYKHMLEKFLNLPVYSMNVVMLKPTITNNIIGSVSLDMSQSPNGIDTFDKEETTVRKILGETSMKFSLTSAQARLKIDSEDSKSIGRRLKTMEMDKVSDLDKIYNDTIKVLGDKLEIIRKRYAYSRTRSFEEFVTAVSQETSSTAALLAIIKYANETTDQLINRYHKMVNKGEIFTPETLMEWRDYITSYDTLDDLQHLLSTNQDLLGDPTALGVLRELISKKKEIIQIYETNGKEVVARRLAPFYNEIRIRRKEELEKQFRILEHRYKKDKKDLTEAEIEMLNKGTTMNEYVSTNLTMEKDAIDRLTYNTLLKELSIASNDVNEITRWVDNLQDTSDPVAAGIVMAYNKQDEKSRLEALEQRLKLVRILRKLEQHKNKTSFTSEKEFYKSILEVEEGQLTNYLIRPWISKLDEEEKAIRAANKTKTDKKAAEDTSAWIEANFELNTHKEEYLFAFNKYLEGLVQDKRISADEKTKIMDNEYFKGAPLTYLAQNEYDTQGNLLQEALISEDAADLALTWKGRNRKLYSDINEKWINPQWAAFMKEVGIDSKKAIALQMEDLRKSENPMAQFYIAIVDMAQKGDSSLPYSYRLGFRLPGISKEKNERLREGQNVSTAFKETVSLGFIRKAEDTSYQTREFTDEKGNPKYFLPIHYNAKLKPEEQSYDLATIYFKFWESANDYANKKEVLPTLEMAKYFVEHRKTERKDSLGNRIMSVIRGNRPATDSDISVNNTSNLAAQLKDWFEIYIYGNTVNRSEIKISDELVVDGHKLVDGLNKFTSLNLLALNVVQGIANITIGEVMTGIDAIAGEYISVKSLSKATAQYSKWFPKMLGDIGSRSPSHVSSLLIEKFGVLNEDITQNMNLSNSTKLKGMLTTNSLGFIQQGGEHWLRSRLLFAFLIEKQAIGKNGESLGPMINQYYSKDGELKLKDQVDLIKSNWTTEEVELFTRKIAGVATRIHGAYGLQEKVAAQRYIIGKLAYMYRKFIIPGIRRRYGKNEYSERLQQTTEGNYVTTWKFFSSLFKEMHGAKLAMMGENWAALSPHEKANIKRTMSEIGMLISTIILANFAYSNWGESDDEDQRFWALLAYQAYRLKAELLFYSPKLDESLSLLRSPMASMSIMENFIKLTEQLFNPFEEYERGPWKGHYKLTKDVIAFIPIYKQYYKFRDIEEQIQWFR